MLEPSAFRVDPRRTLPILTNGEAPTATPERRGCMRVALDDVGSGYSSLNLIHELHPDLLKVDMELIRSADEDPYKARLVANLLDVAAELDIDTLAEGIETEGELRWVQENGAKYVQGYLLGRPAAAARSVSPAAPGIAAA